MGLLQAAKENEPLAARMRPRNLDEFVGQSHIVGKGRLLRRAIKADQLSSLIFYGPPGTGKTTLAQVIAGTTSSRFLSLNAVLGGVKEIRLAIAEAQELKALQGRRTILFVDEVHRWNKAQQDALLPWVENGTIILVGATTENPFFEVNSALVSRSRIFQLKQLEAEDLQKVARQSITDRERGYGAWDVSFEEGALEHLVKTADGDARSLLNSLQLAVETSPVSWPPSEGTKIHIDLKTAEESIQKKVVLYDKEGDYHYDTISAFIKSIRGSDPDAALYWMARMIRAGEDPRYIFRRMIISASEDIGMADPGALVQVNAAAQAFDRVGLPEGQFHLTQAALYLATAPKSNSALAFFDAIKTVETEAAREVPAHLRDPSRDKKGFGHGEGYSYPHAYRDHWVAQAYLPEGLKGRIFYQPSAQGHEAGIQTDLVKRRELQMAAMMEESIESLSYSPGDKERESWIRRTKGKTSTCLLEQRTRIFSVLKAERHHKILVWRESSGLLLWEAWRQVPEGGVCAWFPEKKNLEICQHFVQSLREPERPVLFGSEPKNKVLEILNSHWNSFEGILTRNWLFNLKKDDWHNEKESLLNLLAQTGNLIFLEPLLSESSRLSHFIPENAMASGVRETVRKAEDHAYGQIGNGLNQKELLLAFLEKEGLTNVKWEIIRQEEERFLSRKSLENWLDTETEGRLGFRMKAVLEKELIKEYRKICLENLENRTVSWKSSKILLKTSAKVHSEK